MASQSDSDEDDTFVTIGTPVELYDDDEPSRKPVQLSDMSAKDSSGRPRFHGAFTGGFSAGYFNTVGSKEGFLPSTFISSREKRAEASTSQRPEDFMDDDDVGEFGIAPRKFVTGAQFSSEERKRRRLQEASMATSDSLLAGDSALINLIVPERLTMGVKLLRKMGWKEGQGLGPRQTRKQRHTASKKMYGCAGPPSPDSDDALDDEAILSDITYAPRDTAQIFLGSKDNTHGLGYRGLDPRKALPSTHINLFEEPRVKKSTSSRKGIKGQGFGVGALEDEDDDIYAVDDMSRYDMTMGGEEDDNFGWTAPRRRPADSQKTPVGYVGKLLDGFSLSTQKLVQTKHFPPPTLPRDYRPVHRFKKPDEGEVLSMSGNTATGGVDYRQFLKPSETTASMETQQAQSTVSMTTEGHSEKDRKAVRHDAATRSLVLGEQAFVGSVFDLIPSSDKEKMEQAKQGNTQDAMNIDNTTLPQEPSGSTPDAGQQHNSPLFKGAAIFKPFSKDLTKQQRYDKYLELLKHGHKDPYMMVAEPGHTEWEIEREREEFHKASSLYRPLAGMMAARFTRGGTIEQGQSETQEDTKAPVSDAEKAAAMKMYGKLTREVLEWHPDKLICKRFNVPNPYPGSSIVGLATVKRDKYSVFNFLNFAGPSDTNAWERQSPSAETTQSYDPKSRTATTSTESRKNDNRDKDTSTLDTSSTNRVDKELNKGKAMKSIFSHLMDTEKQTQKDTKPVSFSLKPNKSNTGNKQYKSIFSHLEEEGNTVKNSVEEKASQNKDSKTVESTTTETSKKNVEEDKKKETSEKKSEEGPGMDLFRAIFRNTDSEDSSSSSEEDPAEDSAVLQVSEPQISGDSTVVRQEAEVNRQEGKTSSEDPMETDPVEQKMAYLPTSPSATSLTSLPGNCGPPQPLGGLTDDRQATNSGEESDSYGPSLPPPASNTPTPVSTTPLSSMQHVDHAEDSSRKHKHKKKDRHKDKHKSKKDKKDKHKKSRHKKKDKKKKERKRSKHSRYSDSDSGNTSDKDSSDSDEDADGLNTDMEILNRLKSLQSGRKMRVEELL